MALDSTCVFGGEMLIMQSTAVLMMATLVMTNSCRFLGNNVELEMLTNVSLWS